MKVEFYKYQGTGNDFIIIDDRGEKFPFENASLINSLCEQKFGIGADGLILLRKSATHDFKMLYANSDGKPSTMCGNGGRCIVAFAKQLGLIEEQTSFEATDGIHQAIIKNNFVELKMNDVEEVNQLNNNVFEANTGSPHLVWFVVSTDEYDVVDTGRSIQTMPEYPKGINVNFVEMLEDTSAAETNFLQLNIRTYERGVENETLSCGTGATASAICALSKRKKIEGNYAVTLFTLGGELVVKCNMLSYSSFSNIWLCGPAEKVFKGEFDI